MQVFAIVAMCKNRGIGYKNQLPWKISKDMAFFKRMTTSTPDILRAVIMGRKTWESIEKYGPLSKRINVVVSSTISEIQDVHVCKNLDEAIEYLNELFEPPKETFIVGGSLLYKEALDRQLCEKLYLTKINEEFDCDTFLLPFEDKYKFLKYAEFTDDGNFTFYQNNASFQFEEYIPQI